MESRIFEPLISPFYLDIREFIVAIPRAKISRRVVGGKIIAIVSGTTHICRVNKIFNTDAIILVEIPLILFNDYEDFKICICTFVLW